MGIIASCGHRVDEVDDLNNIATKEWEITEDGWTRAIAYKSVCASCKEDYEKENAILYTEQDEINWFKGEDE